MKQRQAFTSLQLPGKASHGFAAAKKGYREVNGYAAYNGLSKGPGYSYRDDQIQEMAGKSIRDQAIRNKDKGYRVDVGKNGPKIDLDIVNKNMP